MAKYVAINIKSNETDPGDWWWEDTPLAHVPSVDDSSLQAIGLVDSRGIPLYRVPNPIGFGRKFEW